MNRFAALFAALDGTTRTGDRIAALAAYLREAPEADRLWTVALLSGHRPKRAVSATELRLWAAESADIPDWLIEESRAVAGDLAETIALVLPAPVTIGNRTLSDWITLLAGLHGQPTDTRKAAVLGAWAELDGAGRFLFNKLVTGGFRMGVSRGLMTRALAQATGQGEADIAHRLIGDWTPATTTWAALTEGTGNTTQPYPFALATVLEDGPEPLGDPALWRAEWKWTGIRCQMVVRDGTFALWSRGEELVTDRFPELAKLARALPPGSVIDAVVLAWADGAPLPFAALQTRIARKTVSQRVMARTPAHLLAHDLLELDARDLRDAPFDARRARLDALIAGLPPGLPLSASPLLPFDTWATLATTRARARDHQAKGIMLKRGTSPYFTGRGRGDWWKWNAEPFRLDAVMVYAQAGQGRRADLFTDFTLAVRDGASLVPVARAGSGLTDAEITEITAWVRSHTLERFGPVRRVPPVLVFELAFEGVQSSPRHKSGLALRLPSIVRWHPDKPVSGIDTLDTLRALLP